MPKIIGIDLIEIVNDDTSTVVPLGGIIPTIQWATPSGSVSPDGFMLCDGSVIPGGQQVSDAVPDLTVGCFLCGSTTSGNAVGNAGSEVLISENQIPVHSHAGGNSSSSNATHNHPFGTGVNNEAHAHNAGAGGAASTPHRHFTYVRANIGGPTLRTDWKSDGWSTVGFNMGLTKENSNHPHNHPTGGSGNISTNAPHAHPSSIGNPGSFGPHSHTIVASNVGNANPVDVKPSYYDVIYIMRVN